MDHTNRGTTIYATGVRADRCYSSNVNSILAKGRILGLLSMCSTDLPYHTMNAVVILSSLDLFKALVVTPSNIGRVPSRCCEEYVLIKGSYAKLIVLPNSGLGQLSGRRDNVSFPQITYYLCHYHPEYLY
jgi:hypothetical protein